MKKILFCLVILVSNLGMSQDSVSELLETYNKESIPYITVQELDALETEVMLLDARETKEYNTSHLKNAINVGYDYFDINMVTEKITDKSTKIVVYCSLGIRSEDVAEQLKKEGYTNVFNLFGGIFEWKNNDFTVYDNNNEPTDDVHTFSKQWSKWLTKGNKVYSKDKKKND